MFNYVPTVGRQWLSSWDKNVNGADDHESDTSHKTLRPPVISLVLRSRIRDVVPKSTAIWISEDLASFSAEEEEAPPMFWSKWFTITYQDTKRSILMETFFQRILKMKKNRAFSCEFSWIFKKKKSIFCVIDNSGCFLHISVSWILHNRRVVHVCCCFHTCVKKVERCLKACAWEAARPAFFKFTPRPLKCTAAAESQT